jgi:low affinity Fe/Cu permease
VTLFIFTLLILLLLATLPVWPYSQAWGYYPSGGIGVALLVVLTLMLTGELRF